MPFVSMGCIGCQRRGYRHYVWPREAVGAGILGVLEEQLEEEADPAERERILLHTKIIRDADKVDNFRVKAEEPVETMVDVSARQLGREAITQDIFDTFMRHTPILNSNRKTHMDMWVSYFGYLFDFNFAPVSNIFRKNSMWKPWRTVSYIPTWIRQKKCGLSGPRPCHILRNG